MSKTKTAPEPPRAQDLTSEEKRRIVISVPCPRCGAPKRADCRQPRGKILWPAHQARYAAVGSQGKGLIRW